MTLNPVILPTPCAKLFVEAFTGHRFQCRPAASVEVELPNPHRVARLLG